MVGKFDDLAEVFEKGRLDYVGVVETQMRDRVRLVSKENKYQMIGKGRVKWRKKGGRVGLIVKNALNRKLEEICVGNDLESEDILVTRCEKVQANKCMILVVCYMTTTGPLAQEENVKKYTTLEIVVQEFISFPVIVMGDMNGHDGIHGEKVNENGRKLMDFCEGNEFENFIVAIGNSLHTWENREWKAAIDYVLVNHEARQHVREMYVDENEFDIDTDHRMLVLRYKCGGKEVMQQMSSVKEKWCLKAANWEEFDKEPKRRVWNRNGNENDMKKEIAKILYAPPEQIFGKIKCRRFTGKAN
ncbi:Endonuclease/exonuclease/phosphatase [Trinorchestia longiramus]|nr:Endonuclease/exonuclease/phosphatase [Trinorchestia longiramus]